MSFITKKSENKSKLVNGYIDGKIHAQYHELKEKLAAQGYDVSTQAILEDAFKKAIKEMDKVLNGKKTKDDKKALPPTETAKGLANMVLGTNK